MRSGAGVGHDIKAVRGTMVQKNDVLCGRGRRLQKHPGNQFFRLIVQTYREQYQSASLRDHKCLIIDEVIAIIADKG